MWSFFKRALTSNGGVPASTGKVTSVSSYGPTIEHTTTIREVDPTLIQIRVGTVVEEEPHTLNSSMKSEHKGTDAS